MESTSHVLGTLVLSLGVDMKSGGGVELRPSASTWGIFFQNQPDMTYYGKFVSGNQGAVMAAELWSLRSPTKL